MNHFLTAINFPSEISLSIFVSFPSQLCFCTSLPFSRVTTVCGAEHIMRQTFTFYTHRHRKHPVTVCGGVFCPPSLTLVFLSSAVVSSKGSLSLNLISVVLKVLWDFMQMTPWSSTHTIRLGLVLLPTCRVANPTPAEKKEQNTLKMHSVKYTCSICTFLQIQQF